MLDLIWVQTVCLLFCLSADNIYLADKRSERCYAYDLITGNSTVYWADSISTRHMPEQPPNTSKTGHFGVLHNKSSYPNTYIHVGSAPPSCLELKNHHPLPPDRPCPPPFFFL